MFLGRHVDRHALTKLGPALMSQSPALCDVVCAFLTATNGTTELRIEALDVAKVRARAFFLLLWTHACAQNWVLNQLISVELVATKLLVPIMNYVVDFQQQAQQLNAPVVVPIVTEVVTLCLLMPQMKDHPQVVLAMFDWLGTRAASWIVGLCTGIPPEVRSEKDTYGGGPARVKASLLRKVTRCGGESLSLQG